jgi:hypothetical protein
MRWRLLIAEFGPELIYIKGTSNVVADALSRLNITLEPNWYTVFVPDVQSVKSAKLVTRNMDTIQAKKRKQNHGKDCVLISLDLILSNVRKVQNLCNFGV